MITFHWLAEEVKNLYLKLKLKRLLLHLFLCDSMYWNPLSGGHNEMHQMYFNEEIKHFFKKIPYFCLSFFFLTFWLRLR